MLESRPQEDTQDFKWRGWSNGRGQKSKPKQIPRVFNKTKQNIPGQKLSPQKKIACRISEPSGFLQHSRHSQTYFVSSITLRRMTVTSDCFEYTKKKKKKKPYVNQATQKHTLPNFPTPKNPFIKNFKLKITFLNHPCHFKASRNTPGMQQFHFRVFILCLRYIRIYICFSIFPTNMWYLKYVKIPVIDFAILLF